MRPAWLRALAQSNRNLTALIAFVGAANICARSEKCGVNYVDIYWLSGSFQCVSVMTVITTILWDCWGQPHERV